MFAVKPKTIRLRGWPDPVHVRRATSDFLVVIDIFEDGEYEAARKWTFPASAAPVVLDLGGNIGIGVVYFTRLWPGARVITVEPDAENRRLLEANCRRLIESGRVVVVGTFVGARDGDATIDRSGEAWEFRKGDAPSAETRREVIPCLSIPTLLRRAALGDGTRIDVLKCDIEGSEAELFASCAPWIGRVERLIVETHPPYSLSALYADLRRAGWDFDVTAEFDREPYPLCFLTRCRS
jgi:FkbM family methyltransferase